MDKSINKILSAIDDAISKFQESVPGIQKLVYDELQPLLKQIEIKNGKLLNNLNNLKLIGTLQNKLEKIIVNEKYKKNVYDFIKSFSDVSNLNIEYFAQFNKKFKPKNTLPIIKQLAVEATINGLIGQGMKSSLIDPVLKLFNQNITTGGDYVNFQDQIRNHILTNETGDGSMVRYTKQITTDSIHQFNAQYHDTIAQDLNFNWGRYVGSNINTSREFCVWLTKKQWVKREELPEILKGHIDGHNCKLSKTTKLPIGMIPGTNVDNFKILRGGYNCGHQFFWVPDSAVPDAIKKGLNTVAEKVIFKNEAELNTLKKKGYEVNNELFNLLGEEITIENTKVANAYFLPSESKIVIGELPDRIGSPYFQKMVFPHEMGHAIHNTRGIISNGVVSKEFKDHFDGLKEIINGKEEDLHKILVDKRQVATDNEAEQICVISDILGSLTTGKYGWGHQKAYYKSSTNPEAEVFAHGISLMNVPNNFSDITDEVKLLVEKMVAYSQGL